MYCTWDSCEFAAANAIIDALCVHLVKVSDGGISECEAVIRAIHRRRQNYMPMLERKTYRSIAEVKVELQKLADKKIRKEKKAREESLDGKESVRDNVIQSLEDDLAGKQTGLEDGDSDDSDKTDSGNCLCTNHEDCEARPAQIKLTKGFSAKAFVKGNMVNAVKGLRLYENVFIESELSKLNDLVKALRAAGQTGELRGETYVLFNQREKDFKRELVQLGVPIFDQIREDGAVNIEPIPALLLAVIDHLAQWGLISKHIKPNACIINFFDEEERSQPFRKPPHLGGTVVTLFLSEAAVVFGRTLESDHKGNFTGPLMLCLKRGSVLVLRGNSADMASQCVCPSADKRVTITFFRVPHDPEKCQLIPASLAVAGDMAVWQPDAVSRYGCPDEPLFSYGAMDVMPQQGFLCQPVLILPPIVFIPWILPVDTWSVGSGRYGEYLPRRAHARDTWRVGSGQYGEYLPRRAHARDTWRVGSGQYGEYVPRRAHAREDRRLALTSTSISNAPELEPELESESESETVGSRKNAKYGSPSALAHALAQRRREWLDGLVSPAESNAATSEPESESESESKPNAATPEPKSESKPEPERALEP